MLNCKKTSENRHADNTFTSKNHFKNCKLEVRHAFESKTCNLKLDQNTKTTHLRNLTKNQTPLSLAIAQKTTNTTTNTTTNDQPQDDDHRLGCVALLCLIY